MEGYPRLAAFLQAKSRQGLCTPKGGPSLCKALHLSMNSGLLQLSYKVVFPGLQPLPALYSSSFSTISHRSLHAMQT